MLGTINGLAYRGFRAEGGVGKIVGSEYFEVEVMVDLTGSEYLGDALTAVYPAFIFTGWIGTWLLAELGLGGGGGVRDLEVGDEAAAVACRT